MESQAAERKAAEKMLNGVDVGKLFDTIELVKKQPEIAKFNFRITNKWVDGGHNRASIKDFYGAMEVHAHEKPFELDEDEPPLLLGRDLGPNPVEYLLTALAGCLTSSLIYHSAAKGISIRNLESRLDGDLDLRGFLGLDPNVEVGYQSIRVYFKIDADISDEDKEELVRMAQKYSPVFNSVSKSVPVTVELDRS